MSALRAAVLAVGGVTIAQASGVDPRLPAVGIGLLGATLLTVRLASAAGALVRREITGRWLIGWVLGLTAPLAWVIVGSSVLAPLGVSLGVLLYFMVDVLPRLSHATHHFTARAQRAAVSSGP